MYRTYVNVKVYFHMNDGTAYQAYGSVTLETILRSVANYSSVSAYSRNSSRSVTITGISIDRFVNYLILHRLSLLHELVSSFVNINGFQIRIFFLF
ncbi:hypothetical protein PUN28_012703 [Cardiocondyla obscurior]|uniref:Uncharacterized protein n=1 Tax=Cardiocondyla obscurior TaxID=286306 RepID=A0AAW2FH94_9HYME